MRNAPLLSNADVSSLDTSSFYFFFFFWCAKISNVAVQLTLLQEHKQVQYYNTSIHSHMLG